MMMNNGGALLNLRKAQQKKIWKCNQGCKRWAGSDMLLETEYNSKISDNASSEMITHKGF